MVFSAPKAISTVGQPTKGVLLERQKEYRMAALKAKQAGEIDQAKMHIKASKVRCGFYSNLYSHVLLGLCC